MGLPRRSRCGEGGSNPVKVNQTDLALAGADPTTFTEATAVKMAGKPADNGGLGNEEAKESSEGGSGPLSPIRPIGLISKAEDSQARDLQKRACPAAQFGQKSSPDCVSVITHF